MKESIRLKRRLPKQPSGNGFSRCHPHFDANLRGAAGRLLDMAIATDNIVEVLVYTNRPQPLVEKDKRDQLLELLRRSVQNLTSVFAILRGAVDGRGHDAV